ncbi:MAG: transcription termination factor NusA [Patescibacteria group bacterium]|nr:transcription termination factor NusA [Patescibacteria group bacterium]
MSEIINAIKQICEEKSLSYESVIMTIESALAAAYRKDYGEKNQNIKVEYDPATNKSRVFDVKTVVEDLPEEVLAAMAAAEAARLAREAGEEKPEEEKNNKIEIKEDLAESDEDDEEVRRFNPKTEIQESDAKMINPKLSVGDELKIELPTQEEYGRMAAQTAKQVIIQRLREAERDMVFSEYKDKEHEVVTGVVQRREGRVVLVDLGKSVGIILPDDQVRGERYNHNDRIRVYVKEVRSTPKGPEILLSRTSEEILKKIFANEIPEVANGLIEIKSVAREAGNRSKVAVEAHGENIDPIGSCVGQRGARIQTIIRELSGEKIDIIEYSDDPAEFIANALSPAKIAGIDINEEEHRAVVKVVEDQLSLAIGKSGQNVRLAAYLTGWKIDILEGESGEIKESSDDLIVETNNEEE